MGLPRDSGLLLVLRPGPRAYSHGEEEAFQLGQGHAVIQRDTDSVMYILAI